MNATQTATPQRVNWNGRKAAAKPDPYAKRRSFELAALRAMAADGCAAEGESFGEWRSRTGGVR